jgi:hypothetical protein
MSSELMRSPSMSNMQARMAGKLVETFVSLRFKVLLSCRRLIMAMPQALHRGPIERALTLSEEKP